MGERLIFVEGWKTIEGIVGCVLKEELLEGPVFIIADVYRGDGLRDFSRHRKSELSVPNG